jgi:hypothetical protein
MFLKQNTAVTLLLGPFVESSDGITVKTDLSIAASDVKLIKFGASALVAKNSAVAPEHVSNGYYSVHIDTSDTSVAGQFVIVIQKSGALPFEAAFTILTATSYGSMIERVAMDTNYSD